MYQKKKQKALKKIKNKLKNKFMNMLELFAGSRSIGKEAEINNWNVFSVDILAFDKIDYVVNILDFDLSKVPFVPDVIWASPPCTYFSVASIGKHWNKDHTPKTKEALLGVKIVQKTLDIINYFLKINPNLKYYIENPRGKLRKLQVINNYERTTVTYCSYGDIAMKPTDIWSNNIKNLLNPNGWTSKPICKSYKYDKDGNVINQHCHHEMARRGSVSGTQGKKGNYNRSKIPVLLCKEIIDSSYLKPN